MKTKDLTELIDSLTSREINTVKSELMSLDRSGVLLKLLKHYLGNPSADLRNIAKALGVTKKKLTYLNRKLEDGILNSLGKIHSNTTLESRIEVARALVMDVRESAAVPIILDVLKTARLRERFDVILQLFEISRMMIDPISLPGTPEDNVREQLQNLLDYQGLEHRLRKLKSNPVTSDETKRIRSEIKGSTLMQSVDHALSSRAKHLYLKIRTNLLVHDGKFDAATDVQLQLDEHVKQHTWLSDKSEFFFDTDRMTSIKLLLKTGQVGLAQRKMSEAIMMRKVSKRCEIERLAGLYRLRFAMAFRDGNVAIADAAMETMLSAMNHHPSTDSDNLFVKELYFASYYSFCKADFENTGRLLVRLRKCDAGSFPLNLYSLTRILEIAFAYENEDYEGVFSLVRNFKRTKAFSNFVFHKVAASVFQDLASQPMPDIDRMIAGFQEVRVDDRESHLFHFFDCITWLLSLKKRRPMIELIAHQTPDNGATGNAAAS